jgi:ornithine decarboxylase
LCFHVGSQCLVPGAYTKALEICGQVLAAAKVPIQCLDVGGGFPAQYMTNTIPPLEVFIAEIEAGVKALGLRRDCVLMCEPGRALVAEGMSLVVQVQLRKGDRLYINDGIYGSLSEMVTANLRLPARVVRLKGPTSSELTPFKLFGPTCDSVDVLPGTFDLPSDVAEGDWIEIDRLGAYSNANATRFNGFYPETLVLVDDEPVPYDFEGRPAPPTGAHRAPQHAHGRHLNPASAPPSAPPANRSACARRSPPARSPRPPACPRSASPSARSTPTAATGWTRAPTSVPPRPPESAARPR